MTQAVTKELVCVCLYGDIELWVEKERIAPMMDVLQSAERKFLEIDGQLINTSQVTGIFSAATMEDRTGVFPYFRSGFQQSQV